MCGPRLGGPCEGEAGGRLAAGLVVAVLFVALTTQQTEWGERAQQEERAQQG